ncbi:MAG: hypothetical protein ACK5MW_10135 [Enterococcus sp.]
MLKKLYYQRYLKVLCAMILLILGIYLYSGYLSVNTWHHFANSYQQNDSTLRADFDAHPDQFTYWDEQQERDRPYRNFQKFQKANLSVYQSSLGATPSASEYNANYLYYTNTSTGITELCLLIVPLAGFLLFFIDHKTGFTRWLFSLAVTRSQIFWQKIIYLAGPFLASVLLGQLLYALILFMGIPQPYMNATLTQLIVSALSNFILLVTYFSAGALIGSLVGNLVLGPLTLIVFCYLTFALPTAITTTLDLFNNSVLRQTSTTFFIETIGKTGGHWYSNLLFICLSGLLLCLASHAFKKISFDYDGEYLLNPSTRFPIWLVMSSYSTFILLNALIRPWQLYLYQTAENPVSLSYALGATILTTLIITLICGSLVFSTPLKRIWLQYRKKRQ